MKPVILESRRSGHWGSLKQCGLVLALAAAGCSHAQMPPRSVPNGALSLPPGVIAPVNRAATLRFLTQASFGPNAADEDAVGRLGARAWIDKQFLLPARSHRAQWEAADAAIRAADPTRSAGVNEVLDTFWTQALTGPDQLRLRVAFALSQIFVISSIDSAVGNEPRALADWLDMLGANAFGNYRDLLQAVALHPQMGRYLSHLRNQKADPVTGRVPDQNFARESMQLFSIGLVALNPDGTPAGSSETYGPDDVAGLAKVFTGWSWACPAAPSSNTCFNNGRPPNNGEPDPDRAFKPMVPYPQFHSGEEKRFLGVTIPPQNPADPVASLKVALDTLAAHPNVGPFIGRQLIQRLVTSNPSPQYVAAVSQAFANNGAGVRGELKAVIRAVLLHPEAQQPASAAGTGGKLREPVLRLAAFLRAYPHTSDSGQWKVGNTDNPANSLNQTPLRAPSVFNFYRPGYVAPLSNSAARGMVAPELQILDETSAAGWINAMRDNLSRGVGSTFAPTNRRDLQRNWATEMAQAAKPGALVAKVTETLLAGQATQALNDEITAAVASIAVPAFNGNNQAAIDNALRNRVFAALLLTLATPDYIVHR
jgi:uncharacterized protein (DUF1800 family)